MTIKTLSVTCPTVNTPAPATVLTTITITGCTTVQEGSTCQLTATGRDQYGANYPLTGIVWTSLNTTIATINTSGVVSGINWGHSNITARVGTITSSQFDVLVTARPANITAIGTPAPNVTSPVAGEIDINSLTWQNTGGQSDSFIPKVSIDGGTPIALTTTTITLAPGATYTVTNKALTGLSITTGPHTVCPVPN